MIKTKSKKGITLVALIITIVVVLILATVAIRPITDDRIISITKESKDKYQQLNERNSINRAILTTKLVSKNGKITVKGLQKALDAELRGRQSIGYK